MKRIFFDNNATTEVDELVLKDIKTLYSLPLNSSSVHYYGRLSSDILEQSRIRIKNALNAHDYDIIFTSGGTEANNLAILGLKNYFIISSSIEHDSIHNISSIRNIQFIKVDTNGLVDISQLEERLKIISKNYSKFLLSIIHGNNESGVIQDIKKISHLVHRYNGIVHSDMVQSFGKINIDLKDLKPDLVSISAHKVNALQGVGALLIKKNIEIEPIIHGGGQENKKRSGTINLIGVKSLAIVSENIENKIKKYKKVEYLRNYLEHELQKIAHDKIIIFSNKAKRLPNTSCFSTCFIDNKIQFMYFDLNNIMVSIGSACSSGSLKPSRVLSSINSNIDIVKSSIRISLGIDNNIEEVDKFIDFWKKLFYKYY